MSVRIHRRWCLWVAVLLVWTATANACPACSLERGDDRTLYLALGLFLFVPALLATGILLWLRRGLRSRSESS